MAGFVKHAAASGIDIFRIFDSLNYMPNLRAAMAAVQETHAVCEAAVCYTGDILDPKRDKYSLKYYVKLAQELEKMGAHMLAIKDMAGLLRPPAAKVLVKALREAVGTSGAFSHARHRGDAVGGNLAGVRGGGGCGGSGAGRHERQHEPAEPQFHRGGPAAHAAGHGAGPGSAE